MRRLGFRFMSMQVDDFTGSAGLAYTYSFPCDFKTSDEIEMLVRDNYL